jgi:hypothetical protein
MDATRARLAESVETKRNVLEQKTIEANTKPVSRPQRWEYIHGDNTDRYNRPRCGNGREFHGALKHPSPIVTSGYR